MNLAASGSAVKPLKMESALSGKRLASEPKPWHYIHVDTAVPQGAGKRTDMSTQFVSGPGLEDQPEEPCQFDLNRARLVSQCGYTHLHIGGQKINLRHLIGAAEIISGANR